MDRIAPDGAPFVSLVLVDDRVSPLEVIGELEERIVFVRNVLAVDGLLDNFITPIFVEPRMGHGFLPCRRFQKGIGSARNVEINLRGMSNSAWHVMHGSPTL